MRARVRIHMVVVAGLLCAGLSIPAGARAEVVAPPNVYPPFSLFEFHADEAGSRAPFCATGCALAQAAAGQTHVSYKGKMYPAYYYGVTPLGVAKREGTAEYGVDIFDNASDAASYSALTKERSSADEGTPTLSPLTVAHPVAPNEFIVGQRTARGCIAVGGLSYRNLSMYVSVTTQQNIDRSSHCAGEARFVDAVLGLLYIRVNSYATSGRAAVRGQPAR